MNNRIPNRKPQPATLRVGGASEILAVLKDFGVDSDEVLTEAGIHPALFEDPGNLITYAARDRLFRKCVARTECQHFGLLVGQRMNLPSLGLVGLLMRTSPSAGVALDSIVNYLRLHSQGAAMTLTVDGDMIILAYEVFEPGLEAIDQTGDGAVAMMLNVMRSLCGPAFKATEASFAHRSPENIEPFRKFFRIPIYFDAQRYALVFSRKWLDVRPPDADTEVQQLLRVQIDALMAKHSLEFPEQVRNVLRSALMTGHASEEQIASLFSMREHTLSRRLQASGTSFQELVDECRCEIAQQMLRDTSLNVAQISTSLGYSRSSAFIRAFRRWTDSTPAKWRATYNDDV